MRKVVQSSLWQDMRTRLLQSLLWSDACIHRQHATELVIWRITLYAGVATMRVPYNKNTTKKGCLCVALLHIQEMKKQAHIY